MNHGKIKMIKPTEIKIVKSEHPEEGYTELRAALTFQARRRITYLSLYKSDNKSLISQAEEDLRQEVMDYIYKK